MNKQLIKKIIKKIINAFPLPISHRMYVYALKSLAAYRAFVNTSPKIAHVHEIERGEITPSFLLKDAIELAKIEPAIHPNFYSYPSRIPVNKSSSINGKLFARTIREYSTNYDLVLLTNWVNIGGADKVVAIFANTAARLNKKVLVIATESKDNVRPILLSESVDYFSLTPRLVDLQQPLSEEYFLIQFLLYIQPGSIHCINSKKGYDCFKKYGIALVSNQSRLFVSYFGNEQIDDGTEYGFVEDYLQVLDPIVEKNCCDNRAKPLIWEEKYGVPLSHWAVIYNPVDSIGTDLSIKRGEKILWASRFVPDKNINLLLQIAKSLPEREFDVYGPIDMNDPYARSIYQELAKLRNVTMKGTFKKWSELVISDYKLFLFTSKFEGLPNVILEAAASRLPIVGSCVGGVKDFLTEKTGYPVDNNLSSFISAINNIYANPSESMSRAANAYELANNRHTYKSFEKNIKSLYCW